MSVQYARADRRIDGRQMDPHIHGQRSTWRHVAHAALDVDVAKAAAVKPFLSRSLGRKLRTRDDDSRPSPSSHAHFGSCSANGQFFLSETPRQKLPPSSLQMALHKLAYPKRISIELNTNYHFKPLD